MKSFINRAQSAVVSCFTIHNSRRNAQLPCNKTSHTSPFATKIVRYIVPSCLLQKLHLSKKYIISYNLLLRFVKYCFLFFAVFFVFFLTFIVTCTFLPSMINKDYYIYHVD